MIPKSDMNGKYLFEYILKLTVPKLPLELKEMFTPTVLISTCASRWIWSVSQITYTVYYYSNIITCSLYLHLSVILKSRKSRMRKYSSRTGTHFEIISKCFKNGKEWDVLFMSLLYENAIQNTAKKFQAFFGIINMRTIK